MGSTSVIKRRGHVYAPAPGHKRSFALLSEASALEVTRAVIFIHGFSGSASSTWTDFLSLIDNDQAASRWWETSDVFFFHYFWGSIFRRIGDNADSVYNFVNEIFPKPPQQLFQADKVSLRRGFRYRELTLVGHSEGGLLVRKVILEAANRDVKLDAFRRAKPSARLKQPKPQGLLVAQLRLFAPAIAGEALTGMLGVIASLPIISSALRFSSAKLGLAADSAAVLTGRKYTDDWARDLDMDCFRAHIVWADNDSVVDREKYLNDHHCTRSPKGTDHKSVCKPTIRYPFPLRFVERGVEYDQC